MKMPFFLLCTIALSGFLSASAADSKKTRDEMVIEDRDELLNDDTWIYNNLEEAKAEAKAANKPLMIVFRCIP